MTRLEKLVYRLRGIKIPKETINTAKEEMVKKVNDILLEPETIDTMIPACKNCEHCKIYDQSNEKDLGRSPECNRPTGERTESNNFIEGISSTKIERINNPCYNERDYKGWHRAGKFVCDKEAIFFKEKK